MKNGLGLLIHVGLFYTGSDTFRIVLPYGKKQESRKNISQHHFPVDRINKFLDIEKSNSKRLFLDNSKCKAFNRR